MISIYNLQYKYNSSVPSGWYNTKAVWKPRQDLTKIERNQMEFSLFGSKMGCSSGIGELMKDLSAGISRSDTYMLGGGNPAHIHAVQQAFRRSAVDLLGDGDAFEKAVGEYDPPQGNPRFVTALCGLFNREYGWNLAPENVALTNGSQSAFYILFNLLAGRFADGRRKKVLLPLSPEYIGYADLGLEEGLFVSNKPKLEFINDDLFKYHIDFDTLVLDESIGAICVSRPTNPTGNVLTDEEIIRLDGLARRHNIPLILDNAYGLPFPGILFTEAEPFWNENTIVCMSLSKLGLPSVRTGIVIACREVIEAVTEINAVMSLSPGGIGAALAVKLIESGSILSLSREVVCPYYNQKRIRAIEQIIKGLTGLPYAVHKPEGAFFLWLWLRDLPVSSEVMYQRLKQQGVLVVPGHCFFPGLAGDWPRKHQCLRISYAMDDRVVEKGLQIACEEIRKAYQS